MKVMVGTILLISMLVSISMIFFIAPEEETMGVVQKIFYFHVSTAWVGFIAFFCRISRESGLSGKEV
jgi:heme exporter protein C